MSEKLGAKALEGGEPAHFQAQVNYHRDSLSYFCKIKIISVPFNKYSV